MKSSGRNNPCPSCGRNTTSHCRWNDDTILCFHGSTFAPPSDLRIGDTITIDGRPWALIRRDGGFSGNAAVFKPHIEKEPSRGQRLQTPNTAQELLSRQTKRHQWASLIQEFHDAFQAAWNAPDFYSCTPEQLNAAFSTISNAQNCGAGLKPHLRSIWRDHQDLEQLHRLRVESQLKTIAFMAQDALEFQHNDLGTPCPAAVREMAEGF